MNIDVAKLEARATTMRVWAAGLRAATRGMDNPHVVAMVELICTTAEEVAEGAEWLADLAHETDQAIH